MQPCAPIVEGDAHFGSPAGEGRQGVKITRTGVGGREHADAPAPGDKLPDRLLHQPDPAPFHERDEEVRAIGRRELRLKLLCQSGFAGRVDQ